MEWAKLAEQLAQGAERARIAGDEVAMVAMLVQAAQCAKIARLLSTHTPPSTQENDR